MPSILKPVGRGVVESNPGDVKTVQNLLNKFRMPPLKLLDESGELDDATQKAIDEFQRTEVKMARPDGRVNPEGTTLRVLNEGSPAAAVPPKSTGDFTHPDADKVSLHYGPNAVKLNTRADALMRSIVASCGMTKATLTSTLRTYHDQARITITQTYKDDPGKVATWYGREVYEACKKNLKDIQAFADWWQAYDKRRGKVSSLHLSNQAMDVVPDGDRVKFAAKVAELKKVKGSGVRRIIKKGEMKEPVDHVEFHFEVTDGKKTA